MNRKTYSQILDEVAREHLVANTDLAPRILAQIQKGKGTTMQPRTHEGVLRIKRIVTVFLVLLVLVTVLINVPSVRAALQRWMGYIPGIGLVSEGQIRVLAEPVSIAREGITLTVEQVLVDSTQTTILYSVEGLRMDILDIKPQGNTPGCYQEAVLRLPNEELSQTQLTGTSWSTGYQHKATYPVIPSTVNEVTLVMPCIRSALPGEAPENWELSFRLIPAPPQLTAFPVIEISTPVEERATALPPMETSPSLVTDGISLTLDRAVQLDDGYLIYATMHWENTGFIGLEVVGPVIHLLDSSGQELTFSLDLDALQNITPQPGQTALALRTEPIQGSGPLTVAVESVSVMVTADASFSFDPGPDPKPGQAWELNQAVDLAYGHSLRVLRATYPDHTLKNLPPQAGFSFDMESDTGLTGALLIDMEHPLAGGGGGGGGWAVEQFSSGFSYPETLPDGPITVHVESFSVNLPGRWEAQWTPPITEGQIVATAQPSACLTRESWPQALQQPASLPANLTGTLALFDVVPPAYNYEASVVELDGSNRTSLGLGSEPSLSPDGTRVVYVGPSKDGPSNGLYIADLASGNTTHLPGTTTGDITPIWSPDGSKIAFTRGPSSGLVGAPGPYNIMLTDIAGTELRQLTDGEGANRATAWLPDGKQLLYTLAGQNGVSLQIMDIQTAGTSLLSEINYNGTVVISPDGSSLAFEEMLPLDKYGLFVSKLVGSDRKLLADGDPYIVTIPAWSPDGDWIIASVHDPGPDQHNATLALIQVDTCKIIPLTNLSGYVTSWIR